MAEKHLANKKGDYTVISGPPDFCKVGTCVVPFDISRTCDKASVTSPNVNAQGLKVLRIGDVIAGVDGDAGSGVCSGVARGGGDNVIITGTPKVNANGGIPIARHESLVLMNVGGAPNTIGKLQTETSAPLVPVEGGKVPCNNPPKSSDYLKELQALKDKTKFMDPNQLDEFVRFDETSKIMDGWISNIDVTNDGSFLGAAGNYGAQGLRAVLGFVKDAGLGIGNLAYTGAKKLSPGGMFTSQLDNQILMENIRLGNICLETLKQAAKAAGKELAKPVTDAWEKGNYVEAVVRGGLEIGTLLTAVGDLAKLGTVAKGAEAANAVTKGAEAANAVTKGAEAANAATKGTEAANAVTKGSEAANAATKGTEAVNAGAKGSEAASAGSKGSEAANAGSKGSEAANAGSKGSDAANAGSKGSDAAKGGDAAKSGEGGAAKEGGAAEEGGEAKAKGEDGNKVRKKGESKGEFGERMTEEELKKKGYERISKDKNANANGIDGVYKNKNPPPDYIIVESKYGSSELKITKLDGKQMSDGWINGKGSGWDRLSDAVGRDTASTIRDSMANGGVDKVLAKIDEAGNVVFKKLDGAGKVIGNWP